MSTTPESKESTEEVELGSLLDPIQPYIDKYGSKVILGLAAVLLAAAAYIYFTKSANAARAAGWSEMISINAPEDFKDVANDFPATPAAAWATLQEGEAFMKRGVVSSFSDRKKSTEAYDKARDAFKRLINKSGTLKGVRERALYGMARLEECVTGEDTSTAVAAYETLVSEFPSSVYKEEAEARIARLKDPSTKKFYAWYSQQDPSVADPLGMPNDLLPGTPEAPALPETPSLPEGDGGAGTEAPADSGSDGDAAGTDAGSVDAGDSGDAGAVEEGAVKAEAGDGGSQEK